jgi:hypothetical protein
MGFYDCLWGRVRRGYCQRVYKKTERVGIRAVFFYLFFGFYEFCILFCGVYGGGSVQNGDRGWNQMEYCIYSSSAESSMEAPSYLPAQAP